jgi:arabinogalactan endo-1,4-beta-galactosidase
MRLRIFREPIMVGSQVNDLAYTLELSQRIKNAGLGLLLDFHYSDGWADPGKQYIPAAWVDLPHEGLVGEVFQYTRDVIGAFREAGCLPDMIPVGNEINNGMLWDDGRVGGEFDTPEQWDRFAELVRAGLDGVRATCQPEDQVLTMIHHAYGGDQPGCKKFFDNLLARGAEFNLVGLSYYPFWHGTFDDLRHNLAHLAGGYGKDIVVVETGFPHRPQCLPDPGDPDRHMLSLEASKTALPYPLSQEGQRDFLKELIRIIKDTPEGRGTGLFYWAPEHTEVKGWEGPDEHDAAEWYPRALFDRDGEMTLGMTAFED